MGVGSRGRFGRSGALRDRYVQGLRHADAQRSATANLFVTDGVGENPQRMKHKSDTRRWMRSAIAGNVATIHALYFAIHLDRCNGKY